jgi:hypothetical protein
MKQQNITEFPTDPKIIICASTDLKSPIRYFFHKNLVFIGAGLCHRTLDIYLTVTGDRGCGFPWVKDFIVRSKPQELFLLARK